MPAQLRLAFVLLVGLLSAPRARAAEGIELLRPDSLAGWEYGVVPRGWQIADGKLHGSSKSTPLVSGWTLGDFALSFDWSVEDSGALVLSLLDVPAGAGLRLSLSEAGCSLTDAGRALWTTGKLAPVAGALHTAHVVRQGNLLRIDVDSQQLGAVAIEPARRFGLGLEVSAGAAVLGQLRVVEPADERIFNGQNLDGWWSPLGLIGWRAHEGAIECLNKDGNYLRTEKQYANFTLSLEYRQAAHCNSGIGIRTPRGGWPSGDGMELQLQDEPGLNKDSTGAIYGNLEPLGRADRAGEWNTAVIKADGYMISAWINGQLVQQVNTFRHPELKHRHLKGWIGFQDHGGPIEFRNIRVLTAPDGRGLDAWYAPQPRSGPEIVFDRLLNPADLSLDNGVTSGVASQTTTKGGEHVLADLRGPGAVTQIVRSQTRGRLAFYFDAEERPTIDAPVERLRELVPVLAEETQPLTTCVPFAKSLKIVLRDAPAGTYRIEYVTFPPGTPTSTFVPGEPVLPRGWQAAIDYRQHQYGWGTHREEDLAPRTSGATQGLAPGESARLVQLDGAGMVQWLKLEADSAWLRSDDLWLEVRGDGQPEPWFAAPARFWFPALDGALLGLGPVTNHYNFVSVYRNGYTGMLAMPFRKGLSITARNAGERPIGRLGVTLSVLRDGTDPAEPLQLDHRLRLRGRFEQASDQRELVALTGRGRWVGLVTETQPNAGLAGLVVDSRPVAGWDDASLAPFLGGLPGETEFYRVLGGRTSRLSWRYLLLTPVDFQKSLTVSASTSVADRLVLWYEY